ncbi:hypothetical protein [Undibacterium terreum]|uniref:hypothetical protein n=1 Tax=Undibacterium terreum TaxID=1224302 RepID=UPI00166EA707|nr:hypothetical protein [Undibacterium terreum]
MADAVEIHDKWLPTLKKAVAGLSGAGRSIEKIQDVLDSMQLINQHKLTTPVN